MYFNKPINKLTFDDIRHFLKQGVPENTLLDYKYLIPMNKEKFAKTIASFANSMGGTIIIGVKDEHDKPKPPFNGITMHPKVRGQIESIIQTYIDPIVFVDIATCKDPKSNNMFVVINIPQSNLTPHLVGRLKRAYVRSGQASRPEVIVHPNNLPWLLDNRKKSQNLRHILIDKAEAHFDNFLRAQNKNPQEVKGQVSLLLSPLYPQEPLTPYQNLPNFAKKIGLEGVKSSVQDGLIVSLNKNATTELNSYGLFLYKATLENNGQFPFKDFVEGFSTQLKFATNFYKELGVISPLILRLKIARVRGLTIEIADIKKEIVEDFLRLEQNINPIDLQDNLCDIARKILDEASWALNIMPEYL